MKQLPSLTFILQMRKLRLKEIKSIAQSHPASKWQRKFGSWFNFKVCEVSNLQCYFPINMQIGEIVHIIFCKGSNLNVPMQIIFANILQNCNKFLAGYPIFSINNILHVSMAYCTCMNIIFLLILLLLLISIVFNVSKLSAYNSIYLMSYVHSLFYLHYLLPCLII